MQNIVSAYSRQLLKAAEPYLGWMYRRKVSPYPLAVFRILFGIGLLFEVTQTYYFRHLLFDPMPYVEMSRIPSYPLFVFWAIAALGITVGYKTRYLALVNYVVVVTIIGAGAISTDYEWHADSLIITCSLILLFLPSSRVLSISNIRSNGNYKKVSIIYTYTLILVIFAIYFDSILYKWVSPMYLNGLGFWAPSSLPYNVWLDLSPLLDVRSIAVLGGYFTLAFETLFCVLVWFRKFRPSLVVLGILFHILISLSFPLVVFSIVMISLFMGILPANYYTYIFRKIYIQVWSVEDESINRGAGSHLPRASALFFCGAMVVSVAIISFRSPIYRSYLPKQAEPLLAKAYNIAGQFKGYVYPWTGFSNHAVFLEHHFENYTTQLTLYDKRKKEYVPITNRDGTVSSYNTARQWALWTFRTAPPSVDRKKRVRNIKKYVSFWMYKNDTALRKASISIRARPVDVSLRSWRKNLLEENLEEPWKTVGRVYGDSNGELHVSWKPRSKLLPLDRSSQ
ncbi:HTTM domain-containing protein [Salinibacter ruber]|uniref:HTTM domain-containing protein n=1 Tax=Salinibacter ruber TaxID=146919 RepID=UPI00207368FE|nr:HTTM domain-containing protein [Salinibacter ruber]